MRIGVAIPCFIKHINQCLLLLDSINAQTRIPDQVIISCSSSKQGDFPIRTYRFPLKVLLTEERKNASQNRNIAGSNLDTDIVCFFDADDSMHPQRLEAIETAFQKGADIVLHGFFKDQECSSEYPIIRDFQIRQNVLSQCSSGCIKYNPNQQSKYDYTQRIHHGQVSVTSVIFSQVRFPEDQAYQTREDCVFCYRVFNLPQIRSSYIPHPLSKYIASGTVVADHATQKIT